MNNPMRAALASFILIGGAACSDGGDAEQAGENMDSAFEEATQGEENLGDGPLERAGEDIDAATGDDSDTDAADAMSDAVDGDPDTRP